MKTSEAKTLKYGDKVMYHGVQAIVQRVAANGVHVAYDGRGLKAGEYVHARVSASYLDLIVR